MDQVPLPLTPGRDDFGPSLSLSFGGYDPPSPLAHGWPLSELSAIEVDVRKGLSQIAELPSVRAMQRSAREQLRPAVIFERAANPDDDEAYDYAADGALPVVSEAGAPAVPMGGSRPTHGHRGLEIRGGGPFSPGGA